MHFTHLPQDHMIIARYTTGSVCVPVFMLYMVNTVDPGKPEASIRGTLCPQLLTLMVKVFEGDLRNGLNTWTVCLEGMLMHRYLENHPYPSI